MRRGSSARTTPPSKEGADKEKRECPTPFACIASWPRVPKRSIARSSRRSRAAPRRSRVIEHLVKPGVVIGRKKDVPRYAVAEGEPGAFIRRLNGRKDRGRLVNGTFKVIE